MTISLRSIDLDKYLLVDSPQSEIFSPLYHNAIKRLLSSWLFSQLDSNNVSWLNSKSLSIPGLASCENPSAIWATLKEFHAKDSSRNLFDLNKQLNLLKQGPNTSIREHLDKFEMIISQIQQARGLIDKESGLVYTLLESIHPRFNGDKQSIARFVQPLTYDIVFEELLETHKTAPLFTNTPPDEANATQTKTWMKCTKEHCFGPHPANLCHAKNEASRRAWIEKKIIQGLWRGELPEWFKNKPGSQTNLATILECPTPDNPICYHGQTGDKEDIMIFDTGATQHMFNNVNLFKPETLRSEKIGLKLKLAGGGVTLPVQGIGRVTIEGHNDHKMVFKNALYVPQLSKNLIAGCILIQDNINIVKLGTTVELKYN